MGLFKRDYNKPGPGVPKNEAPKQGAALFVAVFWGEFFTLMRLNLLFLLCCLPVVTIPLAVTAACRVEMTMLRDQNHFLWHDFWQTVREEWKPALAIGLPHLLLLAASGWAIGVFRRMAAVTPACYALVLLAGAVFLVLVMMGFYLYPMLAIVRLTPAQLVKNAFLLALACMPRNLAAIALNGALLLVTIFCFPSSVFYLLLLAFALSLLINCFFAFDGLKRYVIWEGETPQNPI